MTNAYIDGDMVVYRVGFTTEDVDHEIASARAYDYINEILTKTNATAYKVFLTTPEDPTAFRYAAYPEYKANRHSPRPKWYRELRDYLEVEFEAEVVKYLEADDAMAIHQVADLAQGIDSVICTNDKDLKQIPGMHYDPTKEKFETISPFEGLRRFYVQLLMGDSSDNVKGIYKVGIKTATDMLSGCKTVQQLFDVVRDAYGNDEEMLMNGRVLWIWRTDDDDWQRHFESLRTQAEKRSAGSHTLGDE